MRVNGTSTILERGVDNVWSDVVDVPVNQLSSVFVEWGTSYGNVEYIKLAEQQQLVSVLREERSVVFNGGYNTNFHLDTDNRNNLEEISQGRSPLDTVDFFITTVGAFPPPNDIVRPFSDVCGKQIPIDTSTGNSGLTNSVTLDNTTSDSSAWWCAEYK